MRRGRRRAPVSGTSWICRIASGGNSAKPSQVAATCASAASTPVTRSASPVVRRPAGMASTCPRSRTAVPRVTDTPPTASGRGVDAGFPPLLGGDRRRRARQRIAAGGGFGKGHDLPNGIGAGEHRRHPVQTEGDAAVRRRAVPKSLEEEAELRLGLLAGQPDHVEDLLLHAGTMDTCLLY